LEDPGKSWNCQFFRSITSDSAIFDPRLTLGMNTKKGRVVDASIAQVPTYAHDLKGRLNFIRALTEFS
jgi:hypothetical protein